MKSLDSCHGKESKEREDHKKVSTGANVENATVNLESSSKSEEEAEDKVDISVFYNVGTCVLMYSII